MIIKNVQVFGEDRVFRSGEVAIADEKFVAPNGQDDVIIDGKGYYAIPGLIDIHFHGSKGDDFCDADVAAIERIAAYQASVGVTSICPATMTLPEAELHNIMKAAASYQGEEGARLVGINLEGPFISSKKKGAQAATYIQTCNLPLFQELQEESGGLIQLVDIAPETEGALAFIEAVKDKVTISIAHTTADYDTAMQAFEAGVSHVTHLYNAMPPLNHRNPGVIGAAFEAKHCFVELICDGIHIHPAVVRATFAMFGAERVVLISDCIRATGLSDGQYTLGGQEVTLKEGKCTLADGTIAGSSKNLMECMKTAVQKMGIPLETAVGCVTMNPAKSIGIYDSYGSITVGKTADLVLLDQDLNVKAIYINGKEYGKEEKH